jgi:hypothetical protein
MLASPNMHRLGLSMTQFACTPKFASTVPQVWLHQAPNQHPKLRHTALVHHHTGRCYQDTVTSQSQQSHRSPLRFTRHYIKAAQRLDLSNPIHIYPAGESLSKFLQSCYQRRSPQTISNFPLPDIFGGIGKRSRRQNKTPSTWSTPGARQWQVW